MRAHFLIDDAESMSSISRSHTECSTLCGSVVPSSECRNRSLIVRTPSVQSEQTPSTWRNFLSLHACLLVSYLARRSVISAYEWGLRVGTRLSEFAVLSKRADIADPEGESTPCNSPSHLPSLCLAYRSRAAKRGRGSEQRGAESGAVR